MSVQYIVGRLAQAIPVVVLVVALTFLMIHLVPGNPARTILGPRASSSSVRALDKQMGLDAPLPLQLSHYFGHVARGDLGSSVINQVPVSQLVRDRLGATLLLIAYAAVLAVAITIPLAALAALRRNGLFDHAIRIVPILGLGIPSFWLALMLILYLGIRTGWFPAGGYGSGLLGHLRALFLPGLTVALSIIPFTIRSLRASMIEVLESDYVAAARARGIGGWWVLWHHALRNALLPVVVIFGLNIGWLVGSTLIVERIFALPGIGALLIDSILGRDFPAVQGLTLVVALLVVSVNVATDLMRAALDPRIRRT